MSRNRFAAAFTVIWCLTPTFATAVERGREGAGRTSGGQSPGGSWSERSHQGGESHTPHNYSASQPGHRTTGSGGEAGAFGARRSPAAGESGAAGAAGLSRRNESSATGAQGAAAGAAAAKRNSPQYSGVQGAAAGAAAAKRNAPQYSGAEGAAAGAAAANRNAPKYSGAEGAAAGAAAANRNSPQFSGAQGAAVGAAAANRNAPALSGAQGAAVGAAVANQNTPAVSGAAGAVAGSAAVRNSFNNYGLYGQQWNAANPGNWAPANWSAGNAWTPTNWGAVAGYVGANNSPMWYDYGVNLTYENGNIMMGDQNLGTAEQFSQQASDLAQAGAAANESPDDQWMPLGVFAMVRNEQQNPQMIMQLAINKQGMLRGNFTDEVTEHTQPIRGSADLKTQRAAWIVGDHKTTVMEAGLSNLAEGDAPALIHKNGKTDHWLLVRLQQPAGDGSSPAAPAAPQ
jgi:hypothetical protein